MGKGSAPRPFTDRPTFEDNWDKIFGKKKSNDTSPHLVEYELNKSTGELERLYESTSKPHEGQFDGNVTDTSSTSKNEEGQLPSSADS